MKYILTPMMSRIKTLRLQVINIRHREGFASLCWRGFLIIIHHLYLFNYSTYYLYEHTMKERCEADFMPKVKELTCKIVFDNQEAEKLAESGYEFRSYQRNARERLDKGAIAFCFFIEKELAHIGWVALTKEAANTFTLPLNIDFLNNQACIGGSLTPFKYRENNFMTYGYYKQFEYLRNKGISSARNAVDTRNRASQKVNAKFSPKIYGKGHDIKILRWQFWIETPIVPRYQDKDPL